MFRLFKASFIALVAVVGAGCSAPEPVARPTVPDEPVAKLPAELPTLEAESKLGLIRENGVIRPGDSLDRAFELMPMPKKAFEFHDPPSVLRREFRARGWEATTESFGVLSLNGRVALAMHTDDTVTQERINEIVASYRTTHPELEPVAMLSATASYWFWEDGGYRIMICASQDAQKRTGVTVGVGEASVMDALRMNPRNARDDQIRLGTLLRSDPASIQ